MGKVVTDEDVERYVETVGRPKPPPSGGGHGMSWNWLMQAFVPPREEREVPPPPPVKVVMRNGVYVDGRPVVERITAPECPGVVPFAEEERDSNPQPIGKTDCSAVELFACEPRLVGAVKDRTPRAPGMSLSSQRHAMLKAKGLCIRCGKERGLSGSKCYCGPCLEYTTDRRRQLRAR